MAFLKRNKWAILTVILIYVDARVGYSCWQEDRKKWIFSQLDDGYKEYEAEDTDDTDDTVPESEPVS